MSNLPVAVAVADFLTLENEPMATPASVVEYQLLMEEMSLDLPTSKRPLAEFLQREEIPIYPEKLVQAYLTERCKEATAETGQSMSVEWRAPRPKDSRSWPLYYAAMIPVEVLKLMQHFKKHFKTAVFEVGYITKQEDPFLRVTVDNEAFIVAHWDEPGFTMGLGRKTWR